MKEYKVMTQKDKGMSGKFNPEEYEELRNFYKSISKADNVTV